MHSHAATYLASLDHVNPLGWTPVVSRCLPGPRLHVKVGSDAAMYPMTSDLVSLPRWALMLPRAL
jgi:hypothetical protein